MNIIHAVYYMPIRHDQYWQRAYTKFLVAQSCIKKELEIYFFVSLSLKKIIAEEGLFSSTALVIDHFKSIEVL